MREIYNPHEIERNIREFWEKNKIPEKLTKLDLKKKKFYLLDGPPYVNQIAHIGHIKTTTMKDIWSKFKLMQGFSSWFQPGFDCHGLPIENMVEKKLGIKSKKDIEAMGVDKFIEMCKQHAEGNEQEWLKLYRVLGAWRGYLDPYLTLKNYYIESGWWTVKKLFEKNIVVEGEKPTFWCPHCETALAGYEVTDSYADVKDPYIYVKFSIKGKEREYIVIFTTTPWTLISNVAIAVHPDEYYAKVKVGNDILIIAEKRVELVLKELCNLEYEIIEKIQGKDLEGLEYEPVLDVPIQHQLKKNDKTHRIILSIPVLKSKSYKKALVKVAVQQKKKDEFFDFVTVTEGSGCVHTAPGHGTEDNYIGEHYELPKVSPVNNEGKFTEDAGEFKNMFVKDSDKFIIEKLKERNLLLHSGWITHAYPLCWRCKSPLIYRLTKQWFFSVDSIKEKMIKENEKVRWLPKFGREKFHNWLNDAIDWCVSRQRYWGIPLPIWVCEKCKSKEVIGSVEELKRKSINKLPKEFDLHIHVVDKIKLKCDKCGSEMFRVRDIMDVWFDSGIGPWASLGYPFKNRELFEKLWPCDIVCESQDQIRGWFYTLMFCGIATFNESPYKSVGLMGWVLDEKGEKMSKSLGNVVWANDALKKLGGDVLRLYYCWEVAPWDIQMFSFKTAEEIRKALNILWNSYTFFLMYSDKKFKPNLTNLKVEDKWLLSKMNVIISEVTQNLENFEFHYTGKKLINFVVDDLSRTYIKLIRDRVWVSESGKDKNTALSTLYEALITSAKLLAPITPFISEEIYQNLKIMDSKHADSIFMCDWPKSNKKLIDKKLEEDMEIVKRIVEACHAARQSARLKLRWPIKQIVVVSEDKKIVEVIKKLRNLLLQMCNAKSVNVVKKKPEGEFSEAGFELGKILIDKKMDEKLLEEAMFRELVREIQSMRKKYGFQIKDNIALTLSSDEKTNKNLKKYLDTLKKEVGAKKIIIGKAEGKFVGELSFEDKKISIAFSKV